MNENLTFTNNEYRLIEKCIDEKLTQLSAWIGNNKLAEKEYIELSALKAKFTAVLYIEAAKIKNKNTKSVIEKNTASKTTDDYITTSLKLSDIVDENVAVEIDALESVVGSDKMYGDSSTVNKVNVNGESRTITESIKVK
jgi:hypothetical protein